VRCETPVFCRGSTLQFYSCWFARKCSLLTPWCRLAGHYTRRTSSSDWLAKPQLGARVGGPLHSVQYWADRPLFFLHSSFPSNQPCLSPVFGRDSTFFLLSVRCDACIHFPTYFQNLIRLSVSDPFLSRRNFFSFHNRKVKVTLSLLPNLIVTSP